MVAQALRILEFVASCDPENLMFSLPQLTATGNGAGNWERHCA